MLNENTTLEKKHETQKGQNCPTELLGNCWQVFSLSFEPFHFNSTVVYSKVEHQAETIMLLGLPWLQLPCS